jgi:O-acetyl-ADP-ribose deacetylase
MEGREVHGDDRDVVTDGHQRFELVLGDITEQPDVDAVVNAANAQLTTGGGVAGAIHDAAGPGLAAECRPLAPITPGSCVVSGAHDLPNRAIVHCLGPVYGRDRPGDALLASCYREALHLADREGLRSVAFPAISTGIFGYPPAEAADVAVRTILATLPQLPAIVLVRMVLFGADDLAVHRRALAAHRP